MISRNKSSIFQGYSQLCCPNVFKIPLHRVRMNSFRHLLSSTCFLKLKLFLMIILSALINANIDKEVHVEQHKDMIAHHNHDLVHKIFLELPQASSACFFHFTHLYFVQNVSFMKNYLELILVVDLKIVLGLQIFLFPIGVCVTSSIMFRVLVEIEFICAKNSIGQTAMLCNHLCKYHLFCKVSIKQQIFILNITKIKFILEKIFGKSLKIGLFDFLRESPGICLGTF